jgi:hypothetical protein
MTIQEFNALDEIGKGEAVLFATYLDFRVEAGYKVSLYALYLFYVEVFYSDVLNETFQMRPFDNIQMLDPYLSGRSINYLLGGRS